MFDNFFFSIIYKELFNLLIFLHTYCDSIILHEQNSHPAQLTINFCNFWV